MLGLELWKTDTTGRAELDVGTGGETRRGLAVVAQEKKSGLHAPGGDWGGEPMAYLVLEGWNEGAREGGKVVGCPGDVPRAIQEKLQPRPGGDVGFGSSAVGEHGVGQLESALMKLIYRTRRCHVGGKSSRRHGRVRTSGSEAARQITVQNIGMLALPQIQFRPVLRPLELWSRRKGLETGARTIGSFIDGMKTDDAADASNSEMAASGRTQEDAAGGKTICEFSWREAGAVSAVG